MIAIDTSTFVAYLAGFGGKDVEVTDWALENKQAALPPVVLAELFSDPELPGNARHFLQRISLLEVLNGFWERAGLLRAELISHGHKARLADSLIAQSCLDHNVALITRDKDFRHFAEMAGLRLFRIG